MSRPRRLTLPLIVWAADSPYKPIRTALSYDPEADEQHVRLAFMKDDETETAVYTFDRMLLAVGTEKAITRDEVTVGPSRIPGWVGLVLVQDDAYPFQVFAERARLQRAEALFETADVEYALACIFGEVTS